jgi:hypothetical protein
VTHQKQAKWPIKRYLQGFLLPSHGRGRWFDPNRAHLALRASRILFHTLFKLYMP